ncbi:carbohydrate ABC transporter permease [Paenibacillus sp. S-38]|uniref:carbohydrate ABC transporter permease n=1 Tax=Paenibacillus sp. S-38 TaxID=3416710 RepID=UPI003CF8D513
MPQPKSWSAQSVLLLLLFVAIAAFTLFPIYALFLASFKPSQELLRYGLNLRFDTELMSLKNYAFIFSGDASNYFGWYKNSLIITVLATLLCLLFSSMVGYGLAVYDFKGRNLVFVLVLIVMMVPVEIILLPLYKLIIGLKMMDSIWGVILPFVVAPLPIFFFRQYAEGLPKDFLDAGRIDGCSEYGIFFRLMAPLMAPAFGAMAILQGMGAWNNFLWPLIVLKSNEKFTLPIGLATLLTPYGNNYDILIAGSVLAILPILILFIFFQRFFVSGLTVGGVKG